MKLIVGLGNPGPEYANHKHNLGYWVVDQLAKQQRLSWEEGSYAWEAWGELDNEEIFLMKPKTWMNLSGKAVRAFVEKRGTGLKDLIVAHDDIDLQPGKMRWVFGSGDGGHNGVNSIINSLGSREFYRLRLGVGRPARGDVAEYVLKPFTGADLRIVEEMTEKGVQAVLDFLKHGLQWVQNKYH